MKETTTATLELAPGHKVGLQLRSPVMVAAGCYGLADEYRGLVDPDSLGAVVVGPLTMHRRRGTDPPRAVPIPGGVLLHTGLANPGLPGTVRRCSRRWAQSPRPVMVHLAAVSPDEVSAACRVLNGIEAVAGVELGLGPNAEAGEAGELVAEAVATYSRGPLLVRLPLESAAELARAAVTAGAHALTVGAPPRGTVSYQGGMITGRLYGPFVLPLALRALRQVAEEVDVPLVGCGGIYRPDDAHAFLQAGATAIQLGAVLWKSPSQVTAIASALGAGGEALDSG